MAKTGTLSSEGHKVVAVGLLLIGLLALAYLADVMGCQCAPPVATGPYASQTNSPTLIPTSSPSSNWAIGDRVWIRATRASMLNYEFSYWSQPSDHDSLAMDEINQLRQWADDLENEWYGYDPDPEMAWQPSRRLDRLVYLWSEALYQYQWGAELYADGVLGDVEWKQDKADEYFMKADALADKADRELKGLERKWGKVSDDGTFDPWDPDASEW